MKADRKLLRLLKRGGYKSTPCPQKELPKAKVDDAPFYHWTCSGCGKHRGIFRQPIEGRTPQMWCADCDTTLDLIKGSEVAKSGATKEDK